MMRHIFFLLSYSLILSGCTKSLYKPLSHGEGFSEKKISENIFTVSFKANEFTDKETTSDFLMLRNADLTLQYKYKYFQIIYSIDDSISSIYTTPISATTIGYRSIYPELNLYSGIYTYTPSYINSTTTIMGGQSYITTTPKLLNIIACFKEKPKNALAFDAQTIRKTILEKYNMKEKTLENKTANASKQ